MKTKRPSDITPATGGTSDDVTSKPKARAGKKSSTANVPGDTLEKGQPTQGAPGASASKAKLPTPKCPPRPTRSQSPRRAPIPKMPAAPRQSTPFAPPPNAGLFREDWPAYRETHAAFPDHLKRIEPRYHRLSTFHSRLSHTCQSLRVETIGFNHTLKPMDAAPPWLQQERASHRCDQKLYGQTLKTYHQKVHDFKMLLSSSDVSQHPKRDALRTTLRQKLDALPVIKTIDVSFIRAYSTFVRTHGLAPARQHHFDSSINALLSEQDTLRSTVTILNQQRAHYRQMASTSVSTNALKQTLQHVNALQHSYQIQFDNHRALRHKIESFITSVESVSTQQKQAGQEREQFKKRQTHLSQKIEALPVIEAGSAAFKFDYNELMLRYGQQQCKDSGLETSCNKLIADHSRNSYSCRRLQLSSQNLQRNVQQALTQEGLDEAEAALLTLQDSLEKYQEDFKAHTSDVSLFHKDLDAARKQFQDSTLKTRYAKLLLLFTNSPPIKERVRPITNEEQRAVDTIADPSLRLKQQQLLSNLENKYLLARRSEYLVKSLLQNIVDNASSNHTPDTIEQFEDDIQTYLDLLSAHNITTTAYEEMKERLLSQIPAPHPAPVTVKPVVSPQPAIKTPKPLSLSPDAKQFLNYLQTRPEPLHDAILVGSIHFNDGPRISPTASERVQIIQKLLANDPTLKLSTLGKHGNSLVHTATCAIHFTAQEQTRLLDGLRNLGADFNQPDPDGDTPLDLSMKLSVTISPVVIEALQRNGAKLSPKESLPISAHLLGTGGKIPLTTPAGKTMVELEGLAERIAQLGLDPVINKAIIETSHGASPPMQGPLHAARSAWQNTRDYSEFIKTIQQAGSGVAPPPVGPKVLITGWVEPNGHAVGFVFNQEADGNYLYACNTGDLQDPRRSIVKYNVTDIDKTVKFFQGCSRDNNETRSFFAQKTSAWGLRRCPKSQQLPDSLDKTSQKRGNCPMASRKACLLAMLWSTSRQNDVPEATVKSTYKEMTTRFRQEGVQQAIESGSVPLMGRALVSMLTKFDRPSCQILAYQLAAAILQSKEPHSTTAKDAQALQIPPVNSKKYLDTLRSALKASRQNLKARKPYYNSDIRVHALRKGNTQAAEIIRRLSS